MDHNTSRRQWSKLSKRFSQRPKSLKVYSSTFWKFVRTHSRPIFTSILLLLLVGLLFGVFSQFRAPVTNSAPGGVTVIDYSTFVKQVKVSNVVAAVIQGDDINALLVNPLSQGNTSAPQAVQRQNANLDYATWIRSVRAGSVSWSNAPASVSIERSVYTHLPVGGDAQLTSFLVSNQVRVTTLPEAGTSNWLAVVWKFAPLLVMLVLLLVFLFPRNNTRSSRQMDERITDIGKSRARRFTRVKESSAPQATANKSTQPQNSTTTTGQSISSTAPRVSLESDVTFADVAGIDEVRTELEEIVQFLRSPERFNRLGARIPRGALLVGPPGTGKTLLAKAVAGEANVPFFSMSASEFVEMFVGVGASRVRDLFNKARQVAPCVIFIDEIDAVGRKRTMRMSGNDERDQTLNQLLVELDGFDARQAVVVLAATNRVDILDKALLRPGRFDRRITVSMPDRAGREAILNVHTRNTPLHQEVSLQRLARLTTGMSGADLANLVNEASLSAARRNLENVTHDCFEDALARIQLGALRPLVMSERERHIIAYHEGGHALVAHHLPEADRVNRVTILPRGQSLGVTHFVAEEDRYNHSRHSLMTRIAVGLGGRMAEELTFGPDYITTGAENDLQVVTNLARRMVTRWGMSEEVGVVFTDYSAEDGHALNMRCIDPDSIPSYTRSFVADADGNLHLNGEEVPVRQHMFAMAAPAPRSTSSASMNALIDAEVQHILNEGRAMAREILTEHNDQLVRLADALMEHEQLDRAGFEALFKD